MTTPTTFHRTVHPAHGRVAVGWARVLGGYPSGDIELDERNRVKLSTKGLSAHDRHGDDYFVEENAEDNNSYYVWKEKIKFARFHCYKCPVDKLPANYQCNWAERTTNGALHASIIAPVGMEVEIIEKQRRMAVLWEIINMPWEYCCTLHIRLKGAADANNPPLPKDPNACQAVLALDAYIYHSMSPEDAWEANQLQEQLYLDQDFWQLIFQWNDSQLDLLLEALDVHCVSSQPDEAMQSAELDEEIRSRRSDRGSSSLVDSMKSLELNKHSSVSVALNQGQEWPVVLTGSIEGITESQYEQIADKYRMPILAALRDCNIGIVGEWCAVVAASIDVLAFCNKPIDNAIFPLTLHVKGLSKPIVFQSGDQFPEIEMDSECRCKHDAHAYESSSNNHTEEVGMVFKQPTSSQSSNTQLGPSKETSVAVHLTSSLIAKLESSTLQCYGYKQKGLQRCCNRRKTSQQIVWCHHHRSQEDQYQQWKRKGVSGMPWWE